MTRTIELDYVLDDPSLPTREQQLQTIHDYGLEPVILMEVGPAGGNPLLQLTGTLEAITKYLKEVYVNPSQYWDELEFYLSLVK